MIDPRLETVWVSPERLQAPPLQLPRQEFAHQRRNRHLLCRNASVLCEREKVGRGAKFEGVVPPQGRRGAENDAEKPEIRLRVFP